MSFQPSETLRSRTYIGLIISQILAAFNDQAIHIVAIFYTSDMLVRFVGLNKYPGWKWFDTPVVIMLGTACFITPFFLFSAWGGMLADRFSKRSSLVFWKVAEVVITGIALAGFLLPHAAAWGWGDPKTLAVVSACMVMSAVFLMGTHSAFFVPAKYGVMPEILQPRVLSRGNGFLEGTSFVAQILGTVTGGLLYFAWQSDVRPDGSIELNQEWLIGVMLFVLAVVGALASLLIQRMPAADPSRPLTWKAWQPLSRNIGTLLRSRPLLLAVLGIAFFAFVTLYARQTLLYNGETHKDLTFAEQELEHRALHKDGPAAPAGDARPAEDEDSAKNAELQVAFLIAFVGLGVGVGSLLAGYLSGSKVELGLVPIGAVCIVLSALLLAVLVEPDWGRGWLTRFQVAPAEAEAIAQPVSYYGKYVALVLLGVSAGFYIVPLYTLLQHRAPKDSKGNLVATSNFINVVGGLVAIGVFYGVTRGLEALRGLTLRGNEVSASGNVQTLQEYVNQLHQKVDFTPLLFIMASAMTLATLLLLCQQLPDFFVRTLLFLRKMTGRGMLSRATIHVTGVNNLPSEGPVILATNCDRPEKCMLVLAATDRVIRWLLLENAPHQRLPLLLRTMVKPISLAVLKPHRQTPEALERALARAVEVLQRGEVVGLPADTESGTFDVEKFLHELRERVPAARVVPVYCGPDDVRNGKEKGKVWIAFDKPAETEMTAGEIRDHIHRLGDYVLEQDRKGKSPALTGETRRPDISLAEDLPGNP